MADYLTARHAIAGLLKVSISSPVVSSIDTVYETRPDAEALSAFPCVLITGYTSTHLRGSSGTRERIYTIGLRLAVTAVGEAPMQEVLEAFKDALADAFDKHTTLGLGGAYHIIQGPNWTTREPFVDAGAMWDEGELVVSIKDVVSMGA